ncbi:MAG: hypothetical protein HYY17_14060 [Planctomycetes bacterium]|nr:hypothetical protein [Planctomycetota bacterium]
MAKAHPWGGELHSVAERDVQDLVRATIGGRGSFRRFRDVVARYPDLDARWFEMRRKALVNEALRRLESLDIKPLYELRPPSRPAPPPTPRGPGIHLDHVLARGAPEGKTEVLEGRGLRVVSAAGESESRGVFKTLARDLCDYKGVAWRKSPIEGKSVIELGAIRIRHAGGRVEVTVEAGQDVLRRFGSA